MSKIVLMVFCALMVFSDVQPVLANPPGISLFRAKARPTEASHAPNYSKYRGNSRHKPHKLGVYKRWRLRSKAQRKIRQRKRAAMIRTTL
jgi:hypothetical protein